MKKIQARRESEHQEGNISYAAKKRKGKGKSLVGWDEMDWLVGRIKQRSELNRNEGGWGWKRVDGEQERRSEASIKVEESDRIL